MVHSAVGKVQRSEQWPIRLGRNSIAAHGKVVFFQQQNKRVRPLLTAEGCPITAFEVSIAELEKQRPVRQGEGLEVSLDSLAPCTTRLFSIGQVPLPS